jgi:hypothetical protein
MGQFSMKITPLPGSLLGGNQQVTAFYREVQALAVNLGLDPDMPPHLVKATLTE